MPLPGASLLSYPAAIPLLLLAATADDLQTAMNRIRLLAYAILDGTLIPIDRVHHQKPYYSGNTDVTA